MEVGYVFKVDEGCSCELGEGLIKGDGTLKNYSKIADMRGGR